MISKKGWLTCSPADLDRDQSGKSTFNGFKCQWFLKEEAVALQGRRSNSCFCGLCAEKWGRRGRMRPQHINFLQVHAQISMTNVYICSHTRTRMKGCLSPQHCLPDTGAVQWVTWWSLPWNRERWACWSMSLANTSLLFTKTNVRAAIQQYGTESPHTKQLPCEELSQQKWHFKQIAHPQTTQSQGQRNTTLNTSKPNKTMHKIRCCELVLIKMRYAYTIECPLIRKVKHQSSNERL